MHILSCKFPMYIQLFSLIHSNFVHRNSCRISCFVDFPLVIFLFVTVQNSGEHTVPDVHNTYMTNIFF